MCKKYFKKATGIIMSFMMLASMLPTSFATTTGLTAQEENLQLATETATAQTETIDRKIVAYFVEWGDKESHQNYTVDKIPWSKVTHINYAFAKVDPATNKITFCNKKEAIEKEYPGQLPNLPYKGHFNLLTKYKQQYPKVKTLISVGGWADTRGFYTMTDTPEGREAFANSCVDFIKTYGFDGVDIDYEYPTATSEAGNPSDFDLSQTRRAKLYKNYDALMQVLRTKLDNASKADGQKYLLTAALPASSWILGGMDTSEAVKYLDFANLMTYDFHGAWNGYVGHNSALYPDSRDPETQGFAMPVLNIDWAKRYFRGALPSEKINIGVPFYTRGWKNVTPGSLPGGLYGSAPKTGGGAVGEDNYWGDVDAQGNEIPGGSNPLWHVKNLLKKPEYKRYFDDVSKVPYVWNEGKKVFLTFEDEESIGHKADYVVNNNLGGVIIWEIDGDYNDGTTGTYGVGDTLTSVLKSKFDAAQPLKPSQPPVMPPTANYSVDFSGKYDHPNYTYTMKINNNTGKEIPKGWKLEFDMPKSCFFTAVWGATLSQPVDKGEFNHYTITGPSWQGIPNGSSATLQGTIKLSFAKGPQNFILNGQSSAVEFPNGTPGDGGDPVSQLKTATMELTSPVDKGAYKVSAKIPEFSNATSYTIKENGQNIATGAVNPTNSSVTTVEKTFTNKADGTYSYTCELTSATQTTVSAPLAVDVKTTTDPNPNDKTTWKENVNYKKGDKVLYLGKTYECIQPHMSLIGWEPANVASLWKLIPTVSAMSMDVEVTTGSAIDIQPRMMMEPESEPVLEPTPEPESEPETPFTNLYPELSNEAILEANHGYMGFGRNTVADMNTTATATGHPIYGNFRMVGYCPSWTFSDVSKLPYDRLTHINYSFIIPKADGSIKPLDNPQKLRDLVANAHAKGVKVNIAVGGWSDGGAELDPVFEALGANEAARNRLVTEVMNVVTTYNLDGVDMDWEYPDPGVSSDNYYKLMKQLSDKLRPQGKLLTAAVSCGRTVDGTDLWAAKAITPEVVALVDWLNIMAYDGGNGNRHSPYSFAEGAAKYWNETRGFSKDKLVLGVPFYGRPSWKPYNQIVAEDSTAPTKDNVGDVYYNGIDTIKRKTTLARNSCSGLMVWEITQDTLDKTSLITAAAEVFGYVAPTDPTNPTDPNNPGNGETPVVEPEETVPAPPADIPNTETVQTASGLKYTYTTTEKSNGQYEVRMTLTNTASSNDWNRSKVPTYGIRFYTDSTVVSFSGGQQLVAMKGGYLAEVKNWQKAIKPGDQISFTVVLQKNGANPKPYGFSLKLLRGENIQPQRAGLPASFAIGKADLKFTDLVNSESKYYETAVTPCDDQLILYNPSNPTQIRIGQAEGAFVNGYTGVKMMVPSKYLAMALGYNQEFFGINPHYMMALGSKENFAFAFQKDRQGDFTTPLQTTDGTWYWGMKPHADGPFQQEVGNFKEMTDFYPDYYLPTANHATYVSATNNPDDKKLITAAICSANSITMTRDFVNAVPKWRFNDFVNIAKDKKAEISLITFIYNRGINSVSPEVFTTKRSENLNADNIMMKNGYLGYGDHVPQVMGMVAKMNAEVTDIYDVQLSEQDVTTFFNELRPFYRAMTDTQWQAMMADVNKAYSILASHSQKSTISFRYDFTTLLRVAKAHMPAPQPAAPMGENFSYQITSKNK